MKTTEIYADGEYLRKTKTWHTEDSPWKAEQIALFVSKHGLRPKTLVETGCGAGKILEELAKHPQFDSVTMRGYDISPQAIEICKQVNVKNIEFLCCDLLADGNSEHFDMLLAIDVFEHVPDYMGFLQKCKVKADYKVYHIPLDLHVSSLLRNRLMAARQSVGHLHYFSAETALATLRDTGHEVVDYTYTNGAAGLFKQHPSVRRAVANGPRWLFSRFSVPMTARLFGGYSLLVLTK
jgi:SAM-dependent methyltransferase